MTLGNLGFRLPGLCLTLNGTYELESGEIDLHGKAQMDATLSETTKGTRGAVVPIKIQGTRQAPTRARPGDQALTRRNSSRQTHIQ